MTTNYARGHQAEQYAAAYLKKLGYSILHRNWKTRWCEIDIIAQKDGCVYFVEVKYRQTSNQGFGLDYITPNKLKQMQFAADFWIQDNQWQKDCCLGAIEISGPNFAVSPLVLVS